MDKGNFCFWLSSVAFGSYFLYLVFWRIWPEAGREDVPLPPPPPGRTARLLFQVASQEDRDLGPIDLDPKEPLILSSAATELTRSLARRYLRGDGVEADHLRIEWRPEYGRYAASSPGNAPFKHNGEAVPAGKAVPLQDGDLLELSDTTMLRFSMTTESDELPRRS